MSHVVLNRCTERIAKVLDIARRLPSGYLEVLGNVAAVGIPFPTNLLVYPLYTMKIGHGLYGMLERVVPIRKCRPREIIDVGS